jgi:hypothetical protein
VAKNSQVKVTRADGSVEVRSAGSFKAKGARPKVSWRRRTSKAERQALVAHRRLNDEMERAAARDE